MEIVEVIGTEFSETNGRAKRPCVECAQRVRSCARPCLSIYRKVSCTVLHRITEA